MLEQGVIILTPWLELESTWWKQGIKDQLYNYNSLVEDCSNNKVTPIEIGHAY